MAEILSGKATDAQIAALLVALHMKGETVEEIVGFAEAIRAAAQPSALRMAPRSTSAAPTATPWWIPAAPAATPVTPSISPP